MKRHGECHAIHFGEGRVAGYSMIQLIETSLISAHFADRTNAAYLDIFSGKPYDPAAVKPLRKCFLRRLEKTDGHSTAVRARGLWQDGPVSCDKEQE